jgi:hypothetical protein
MATFTIKLQDLPKKIRENHKDRITLIISAIQQTC